MVVQEKVSESQVKVGTSGGRRFLQCRMLHCNDKAGGDGLTPEQKAAAEAAAAADEEKNKHMVPLAKLNALNEKFKTVMSELETLKGAKAKEEQDKLVESGKLKEALELKEKEISTLKGSIESITGQFRQTQIISRVKDEISKHSPKDVNDILALIDIKGLTIEEDDNKSIIGIKGLDKVLETLKKEKDYLFGTKSTKNDTKNNEENGRHGAGDLATLEAEYRVLLAKPNNQMSLVEKQRLMEITKKIQELREKK